MKKIILFILVFITTIYLCVSVHADAYMKYPSSSSTYTYLEDTYTLEYKEPYNIFRINKNNTSYAYFEINGYTLNKVKMKVINNYLYLFGCTQVRIGDEWKFYYVPVLYKFTLNPDYLGFYEYLSVADTGELYSFISSIETIGNCIYISLGYNLQRNTMNYYGNYKIIKLDENFNEIGSYSLASDEINLTKIYDLLVINNFFLDRNLIKKESYDYYGSYLGSYVLENDTLVNGNLTIKGSSISVPGEYTLKEGEYKAKAIIVEPIVEIKEEDGKASYRVSGGDVYINNEISSLTGEISEPGDYTIVVKGIGLYSYKREFRVNPAFNFNNKEEYEVGDVLEFEGDAYLNDFKIESGYEIKEAGDYVLEFKVNNEVVKSYSFIVNEPLITKDDKRIMYIALSIMFILSIIVLVVILIIDIIKRRKAKKALYE